MLREMCCQVKELWVEVSRLCSINYKKMINQIFSETLQLLESECPATGEDQEEPVPVISESGNSHNDEGWKLMIPPTRRKALALPHDLLLQNRLAALVVDEDPGVLSNGASQMAEPEPHITTRMKW